MEHFGDNGNALAPLLNGSYALMATGTATGTDHNVQLNSSNFVEDPVKPENKRTYDVVEWRLNLKAPMNAGGFRIHYVFFSTEYDEYVGTPFNDKFYIMLRAGSTNSGAQTVINFTECRDTGPMAYKDEECSEELEQKGVCKQGDALCYIAINTALSECCWYDGCEDGKATTDISGTGYSCAPQQSDEMDMTTPVPSPNQSKGALFGSSTGWLVTEWPIEPGEPFQIVFHLHDREDAKLDSEVIIDKFLFVENANPGTSIL